jgi:hypothetical protein
MPRWPSPEGEMLTEILSIERARERWFWKIIPVLVGVASIAGVVSAVFTGLVWAGLTLR